MPKILTLDDFQIIKKIGDGQYSKVYLAKEKNINRTVALKISSIKMSDKNALEENMKREIKIHHSLHHENILRFFGYFSDEKAFYMILEYCKHGEMYSDIMKCKGYPDERAASYIFQLSHALHFCHKNGIIHRDIKSENIIISTTGALKLADFGCSKKIRKEKRDTFCGTLSYLAPEVISGDVQSTKVDIWGLGVLLFEMLTTKNPFQSDNELVIRENISNVRYNILDTIDFFAEYLLFSVLRKDPMERLSAKQLLTFPYVEKFAEKSLTECKAAIKQWTEINNQSEVSLEISFNPKCPSFNFNALSPNQDNIDIHDLDIGDNSFSLLNNNLPEVIGED